MQRSSQPPYESTPRPARTALRLGGALTLAALAGACSDAGGKASTSGGGGGPGADLPLAVDFALRRDLQIGDSFVNDVHAADLDGDGLTDLVEANFFDAAVSIALGNADGSFTPIGSFPTVGFAFKVSTGDFDGDGREDVAAVCGDFDGASVSGVSVLLQGPADGEFGSLQSDLVLDGDPKDVAVGPVSGLAGDSTGARELLVAVRDLKSVLRLQLDAGELVEVERFGSGALGAVGGPFSCALADLGGDGILDVVVGEVDVVDGSPDRVVAFPRETAGFGDPILVLAGAEFPLVEAVGDVDDNGFDDVSVAQLESDEVFLLAGDSGGLGTIESLIFEGNTSSVVFADVNDDDLADVIGTVFETNAIEVRLADGPMSWGDPIFYQSGILPRAIGLIELPGDTVPDLLCANQEDVSVLYGLGQGAFRGAVGFPTETGGPVAVVTEDLDRDGDLDAIAIAVFQQAVSFMEGRDDGSLVTVTTVPLVPTDNETPGFLAIEDMDGDGDRDVLITVQEPNQVRLLRNNGTVDGFDEAEPSDVYEVGARPTGIVTGDVNGDTLPDVVVGNLDDDSIQVLLNTGNGEFQVQDAIGIGASPAALVLVDLDADEILDLVLTTGAPTLGDGSETDSGSCLVLRGDGNGDFVLTTVLPVDSTATSLDVADLDGDGLPEIVVAPTGLEFEALNILRNGGDLAFEREDLVVGPSPANVAIIDINRDGNLDLFVPSGGGELLIAPGDGQGGFGELLPGELGALPVLRDTIGFDLADLTDDELPELLFVASHSPFVWVGVNTSVELPGN